MPVSVSFPVPIMKSTARIIAGLALTGLLGACSGHKPVTATAGRPAALKPRIQPPLQAQSDRKMYYLPPPPGQWTVQDTLQVYGERVKDKLGYYFAEAEVSYPPKEVVFIALKQEKKLELWARDNGNFQLIRDYYILAASGEAGPKLRQGDRQVPEGVYRIAGLNPNSHYHLSIKLNYPNEFDLLHAWQERRANPGSDIFIHGKAASVGCLAMGDEAIEELFVLAAQVGAENVKVVIAPHDPRVYPLQVDSEDLPPWTPELYSLISREILALSSGGKSVKTGAF